MLRKIRFVLPILWASVAVAEVHEITVNDDIRGAIAQLVPGDVLLLSAGTYRLDSRFNISVVGSQNLPISIRAKDGEDVLIHMDTRAQNILEVQNSQYLDISGIEFTGGSHGIRLINSDYITIEDCEVHETGDVAISANSGGTYEGLKILRNHIHHTNGTGEGMYLGCNYDGCRIANSLIEGNYIHHTNRATVEQGDGIEIKEGSYGNVVRDNVIHDTKYPGILLYSTVGNGPPNTVEGNIVWNVSDNTMQIAADAVVRNNIVLGNVSFRSHQAGSPSNIEFVHNTVINDGSGIEVRNVSGPVLIANNAVYSQSQAIRLISGDLSQVQLLGNVGAGGLSGASSGYVDGNGISNDMVSGNYNGAPPIDPFPAPGSALVDAGNFAYITAIDFNGNPRSGNPDAGAYAFDQNGNPGWTIAGGFKATSSETNVPMPPEDLRTD